MTVLHFQSRGVVKCPVCPGRLHVSCMTGVRTCPNDQIGQTCMSVSKMHECLPASLSPINGVSVSPGLANTWDTRTRAYEILRGCRYGVGIVLVKMPPV